MVDVLATSASSVRYSTTVAGAAGITSNPRDLAHEVNSAQSDRYAFLVLAAWAASTYSPGRAARRSSDPEAGAAGATGRGSF